MRGSVFILILLAILATMAVVLVACNQGARSDRQDFILRGKLDNAEGRVLLLEELSPNEVVLIDTIHLAPDGGFHFRMDIEDAGFYILRISKHNAVTLLIHPGERIQLTADAEDVALTSVVKGSPGSELVGRLNKVQRRNYLFLDSLTREVRAAQYEPDFYERRKVLGQTFQEMYAEHQEFIKQFIDDHPRSLASVIALYQYFGNRMLLTEKDHFEYFESLSQSLSAVYPGNKHVIDLKRRVSEVRRREMQRRLAEENLQPGKPAPDVVLPDPDGEMISLSSLKGKVVLLDFWAAWCPPCRTSNKQLRSIYEQYQPMGFEIYAVSLDRTAEQWLAGIKEDQITWIQVSDLRVWNSPVVSIYNVEEIPHAVLIDRDGTILVRNITPPELEVKLKEIFSEGLISGS